MLKLSSVERLACQTSHLRRQRRAFALADQPQQAQLGLVGGRIDAEQALPRAQIGVDAFGVHVQQIGQRVIDDLDHAHQDDDLDRQRDQAGQRIVLLPLVELRLALGDGVLVAEVLDVQPVDLRLHAHHLQAVAMLTGSRMTLLMSVKRMIARP